MCGSSGFPYLYLHGLASSPGSRKAAALGRRLAEYGAVLSAPDLNVPTFETMTITAQTRAVAAMVERVAPSGGRVRLIGSSLGVLSTLLYASRHPQRVERVVLLAPALGFVGARLAGLAGSTLEEWRVRGYLEIVHYDDLVHRLGFQLVEDAGGHDFGALSPLMPLMIIHGTRDEVIPYELSDAWARGRPNVRLCGISQGDHSLMEHLDKVWELCRGFFGLESVSPPPPAAGIR